MYLRKIFVWYPLLSRPLLIIIISMKNQMVHNLWEKDLYVISQQPRSRSAHMCNLIRAFFDHQYTYCIWPIYRTYPYKHTVEQFHSLQITASVLLSTILKKTYVVGTHLNCINLLMQFKWVPTTYAIIKEIRKRKHKTIA